MYKPATYFRLFALTIILLIAGKGLLAGEVSPGSLLSLRGHAAQAPALTSYDDGIVSQEPSGLQEQSGSFKTAFARRIHKSKIHRAGSQRCGSRAASAAGDPFPMTVFSFDSSFHHDTRPYYYAFLFRLTPF